MSWFIRARGRSSQAASIQVTDQSTLLSSHSLSPPSLYLIPPLNTSLIHSTCCCYLPVNLSLFCSNFQATHTPLLLLTCSSMLEDIVCRVVCPNDAIFRFHASSVMQRIQPSCQTVLISLFYCCTALSLKTTLFSCNYRLWIASLILADLYLNDNSYTCQSWSEVSGLEAKECAHIKTLLLRMLGWSLEVSTFAYSCWLDKLSLLQRSMALSVVTQPRLIQSTLNNHACLV